MKMQTERRALDKIFKRRDRYDIPEWQRDEVWPQEKKQLLIDTILRGWKLPKFYFAKVSNSPEEYEVVDGQQRLASIYEFFEGGLVLATDVDGAEAGAKYSDLPDSLVDQFDDYEIEFDVITDASEQELKEFFQRLQGGLQLTSSEKLNSVHSKLTDYVRALSKHNFFRSKVSIGNARLAHFDIVSKVAAIELDGLDTGLRYDDLKSTFESNAAFSSSSSAAKRLRETFDYLDKVFDSKSPHLRNRSTIQSYVTLAAKVIEAGGAQAVTDKLRRFYEHFGRELSRQVELGQAATDTDYLEFQRTLSANIKAGAKIRHQILLRKLLAFDPALAAVLGPSAVVGSGLALEIGRLAESISTHMAQLNQRYSAAHGRDLFKATSKTVAALQQIKVALRGYDDYGAFVDHLYFLLREGVGDRLDSVPESFADVNNLRTALRHDVDHGKSGEVASKRMKLGTSFKRYSGEPSPEALAPELFLVFQANLLRAIDSDLSRMLASLP